MKASELIALLQDAIDKYGDLPVETFDYNANADNVKNISLLAEEGWEDEDNPKRIFLET